MEKLMKKKLDGSEKQVAWARKLMLCELALAVERNIKDIGSIRKAIRKSGYDANKIFETALELFPSEAKWYIENRWDLSSKAIKFIQISLHVNYPKENSEEAIAEMKKELKL